MRNMQRLDRVLSNSGYGTRKEARQIIKGGKVKVDGATAADCGMHIDPEQSNIEVGGKTVAYSRYIYIMMNKPAGVISATYDKRQQTVMDLLPDKYRRMGLFPAGRLDIDSEGLLLLTNDGTLAHNLLSPGKHIPKKYYVLVEGIIDRIDAERFEKGIELDDGYVTRPACLNIIKKGLRSEAEVIIHEGKFHQVKRMFRATGKKVLYLRRVEMGGLILDEGLKPGEYRLLTPDEIHVLKTGNNTGEI